MIHGKERSTRQGAAIEALLRRSDGFRSAQDLYSQLRGDGFKIGLTTVYRHLQTLAETGTVDVLRTADGEAVYRRCGTGSHHHHLVCRACGRTVEIEEPSIERWAERVSRAAGFADVEHTVEITGLCGDCARSQAAGPQASAHIADTAAPA
jgi:Fur family ferric uptake transcriptional regulator